jgi:predicted secreted protein
MSITGGIVIFVVLWWLCFFMALPIGVKGQWEGDEAAPGTEAGAPQNPMLVKKALWATGGAAILTALAALILPHWLAQ